MEHKVFTTTVKQIWKQKISVIAASEEEALDLIKNGQYDLHDSPTYYTDIDINGCELTKGQ